MYHRKVNTFVIPCDNAFTSEVCMLIEVDVVTYLSLEGAIKSCYYHNLASIGHLFTELHNIWELNDKTNYV